MRRPESGRLIPQAAQRRLDRTCSGSLSGANSRAVFLCCRTCIKGLPPSVCGLGSLTIFSPWAKLKDEAPAIQTTPVAAVALKNSRRLISLRMPHSFRQTSPKKAWNFFIATKFPGPLVLPDRFAFPV